MHQHGDRLCGQTENSAAENEDIVSGIYHVESQKEHLPITIGSLATTDSSDAYAVGDAVT